MCNMMEEWVDQQPRSVKLINDDLAQNVQVIKQDTVLLCVFCIFASSSEHTTAYLTDEGASVCASHKSDTEFSESER